MSQINANIVVEPFDLTIQQVDPGITITPNTTSLNVITGGFAIPGGNNGALQYNNGQSFGGVPNVNYLTGNLFLGDASNVKIDGGVNTYFLQTDGLGNLTWAPATGNISGNGVPGGSNTQIQYNDGNAAFGGTAGFTFNKVNNQVNMPGNLIAVGNITGNVFIGNGSGLSALAGANVTGIVDNANVANTANTCNVANTVSNNVQANITSLGNLTNLRIVGTTSLQDVKEKANIGSPISGNITINVLDQVVYLYPNNATANWFFLVQGNANTTFSSITNVGESITFTVINKNGANGYFGNRIYIDGSLTGVNWLRGGTTGAPTSGTTNGFDVYTFNIFKTSTVPTAYTVFGSKIGFSVT